jgi:hypothetical protein
LKQALKISSQQTNSIESLCSPIASQIFIVLIARLSSQFNAIFSTDQSTEKMMYMLLIFALSLNVVMPLEACEKGDVCTRRDGNPGIVKDAGECKVLLSVARTGRSRFMPCGFEGSIPLVCCPAESSPKVETQMLGIAQFHDPFQVRSVRKATQECDNFGPRPLNIFVDKIMNGKESQVGEFPHFAQLGYQKDNDFEFSCGGALISANFVLTAAHCCLDSLKLKVVRLGKVKKAFEFVVVKC